MDSSTSLQDSLPPDKEMFVSMYDEVCRVISEYETDTISKFIIRRVDKEFGSKGQCTIKKIMTLSWHLFLPLKLLGVV